jgi:hypothetical protein
MKSGTEVAFELVDALLNTRVRKFPYLHQRLDGIFESESLAMIEHHYPTHEEMMPLGEALGMLPRANNPDDLRRATDLSPSSIVKRQSRNSMQECFWSEFASVMFSREFNELFLNEYVGFVSDHPLIERLSGKPTKNWLMLQSDSTSFHVAPHTQDPQEIYVAIIYLPVAGNDIKSGTSMYLPKNRAQSDVGYLRAERDDFYLVRTAEYLRNSGFAFFKSSKSWHGVEPISSTIPRRSIYFSIGVELD